ncbi:zinc metalloprotease [Sporobolomyces salmoneus]|uniref:zinc metalloprotease n=1 Tax=Sporobolomyces salmoneus TaxID=183962 RepID=UPI003177F2C0
MAELLQNIASRLDDPSIPYQKVVLCVLLSVSAFESFIGSRQKPYLDPVRFPNLPSALRPFLTSPDAHDTYRKSQSYARHKLSFSSVTGIIGLLQSFLLLTNLSLPLLERFNVPNPTPLTRATQGNWTLLKGLWDLAGMVPGVKGELKQTASFIAIMNLMGTVLAVPEGLYKNFVLEEKHGFNKMTYGTFFKDLVKGLLLSFALEIPLSVGLVALIHWVGTSALLRLLAWVLGFSTLLVVLMVPLGPYVIMPLFNKFTPLEKDHPVYPKVRDLAQRVGFPCDRIYVIDGSKRSSHSNAFVTGIPGLQKQIVIYDTLLEKATPDEVEAILAHELAHWKFSHIIYLLLTALTQIAFSLSLFTLFLSNSSLLTSFGFQQPLVSKLLSHTNLSTGPTVISLFLASTLFSPLSGFLGFVTNTITRKLEYEADAFAVSLGDETAKNLKTALIGIHEKNLAVYQVDKLFSAWNHNHPTLIERLEALDKGIAEEQKKTK